MLFRPLLRNTCHYTVELKETLFFLSSYGHAECNLLLNQDVFENPLFQSSKELESASMSYKC